MNAQKKSKLMMQYLCGIITESQLHEAIESDRIKFSDLPNDGYELQGGSNTKDNKFRFEQLKKDLEVYGDFLADMETGGKYEKIRHLIGEPVIQQIKKMIQVNSGLIAKMQAAAYAPRS